jgi:hypothetical protein
MKALKIATLILATIALAQTAAADKLCLQSKVNKKTLKVTNKSVVAAKCPRGYTAIANTSSFQGPAGAVNISACRTVSQTCYHGFGTNTCAANCANGEFVLQEYTSINFGSCPSVNSTIGTGPSQTYSNGVSAGVIFYTFTTYACSYTAVVNAVCCPR